MVLMVMMNNIWSHFMFSNFWNILQKMFTILYQSVSPIAHYKWNISDVIHLIIYENQKAFYLKNSNSGHLEIDTLMQNQYLP